MTKADDAERTAPQFEWKIQREIVLWQQWRLAIHDRTPIAWKFLNDMFTGSLLSRFGYTNPRDRPTPAEEATIIALSAVVNQFYARYTLPDIDVPDYLDMYLHRQDEDVRRDYPDAPPRPSPEPADWYLHIAGALGLLEHEDWDEIDATIRFIVSLAGEMLGLYGENDPEDVALAKVLVYMVDIIGMNYTAERAVLDGTLSVSQDKWYMTGLLEAWRRKMGDDPS